MNEDQQALFARVVANEYNRSRLLFGRIKPNDVLNVVFAKSSATRFAATKGTAKISGSEIIAIAKDVCAVMAVVCPYVNNQ